MNISTGLPQTLVGELCRTTAMILVNKCKIEEMRQMSGFGF